MSETDDQLARRLLGSVLDGDLKWTPDMRLRIATVSQAYVSLAILGELRRLNEDRSQWYREVLEVLTQAKEPEGSLRSGQPAAATGCIVCGNDNSVGKECKTGGLTEQQWNKHLSAWYRRFRSDGLERAEAHRRAFEVMDNRFGPCPEES